MKNLLRIDKFFISSKYPIKKNGIDTNNIFILKNAKNGDKIIKFIK